MSADLQALARAWLTGEPGAGHALHDAIEEAGGLAAVAHWSEVHGVGEALNLAGYSLVYISRPLGRWKHCRAGLLNGNWSRTGFVSIASARAAGERALRRALTRPSPTPDTPG